jgi:predicted amidophosphoribosyltransferase
MNESAKIIILPCSCGRNEHYEDAVYCGRCGKKLERAACDDTPCDDHL